MRRLGPKSRRWLTARLPAIAVLGGSWYFCIVKKRKKSFLVVVGRDMTANGAYRWSAYCPEIPGCVTDGKTEAEARRNIREAIVGFLEAETMLRKRPPKPTVYRVAV